MKSEIISRSPAETISAGKKTGKKLKAGDIVCLEGDLGAGKTHFVKGIAAALEINPEEVLSPTYTLIHEYEGTLPLYHFDCYRMESSREALEIGAEEYFYGEGICVIEWPERIASLIPPEALWITIDIEDRETRKFIIGKNSL